jgi:hypothetical protein
LEGEEGQEGEEGDFLRRFQGLSLVGDFSTWGQGHSLFPGALSALAKAPQGRKKIAWGEPTEGRA